MALNLYDKAKSEFEHFLDSLGPAETELVHKALKLVENMRTSQFVDDVYEEVHSKDKVVQLFSQP